MENNTIIKSKNLSLLDIENQLQSLFYPSPTVQEEHEEFRMATLNFSNVFEKYDSLKYEMIIEAMFCELDQQKQKN